jgi:IS5 family transposase
LCGELVRRELDRAVFAAVTRQLDRRGVVVRTGTLVDATLIPSASPKDGEGRWAERSKVPAASLLE